MSQQGQSHWILHGRISAALRASPNLERMWNPAAWFWGPKSLRGMKRAERRLYCRALEVKCATMEADPHDRLLLRWMKATLLQRAWWVLTGSMLLAEVLECSTPGGVNKFRRYQLRVKHARLIVKAGNETARPDGVWVCRMVDVSRSHIAVVFPDSQEDQNRLLEDTKGIDIGAMQVWKVK